MKYLLSHRLYIGGASIRKSTLIRKSNIIRIIKDYSSKRRDSMGIELSSKKAGNMLGIVSLVVAILVFLPILNWFFKITPYQKFKGLPLMIAPYKFYWIYFWLYIGKSII